MTLDLTPITALTEGWPGWALDVAGLLSVFVLFALMFCPSFLDWLYRVSLRLPVCTPGSCYCRRTCEFFE